MNSATQRLASLLFAFTKSVLICFVCVSISVCTVQAQKKKPGGGGQKPNTKSNATIPSSKTTKEKSNTGDNTTLSQSGDNKRFPSGKTATTTNKSLGTNKAKIKSKQSENAKFKGNDELKTHPHHVNPRDARERGNNTEPTDYSKYEAQRQEAMKALEKPSLHMHEYKGEIVVKQKKADHEAPDVYHKERTTPPIDHSLYQGYRKKAFERKQAALNHMNAEGTEQYGQRPSGEFVDLEGRKSMRQAKESERFTYTGKFDLSKKKAESKEKENEVYKYSGDIDLTERDKQRREKQNEIASNSGDIDLRERDKKRRESQNEIAAYSGDIDLAARDQMRREKQKEIAENTGDIDLTARDKMRREKQKEIATSSGDISMHDVMKKAREIRIKEKTISNYSGDILVKTLRERDNRIRIKAKKIANWEGDVVIAKKRKGAHPSAAYRGGKVANSYRQKEKYRKQMLKKYGRNSGMETPNYQRKKDDKPTYDKEEGKIWDVQKYKDSKTKETQ